jgi:hypothetical protein
MKNHLFNSRQPLQSSNPLDSENIHPSAFKAWACEGPGIYSVGTAAAKHNLGSFTARRNIFRARSALDFRSRYSPDQKKAELSRISRPGQQGDYLAGGGTSSPPLASDYPPAFSHSPNISLKQQQIVRAYNFQDAVDKQKMVDAFLGSRRQILMAEDSDSDTPSFL